jgi:hypothetical protein
MVKDLYTVDGVVETSYDPSIKSIIVTWIHLGPHDHLRPCLEAQVDCVENDGAKVILVDTAESTGVLAQVDQTWFGEYVFPTYQRNGVKAVITVVPKSALTNLAAKQWQKTGSDFGVDFVEVDTIKTARKLAADYTSN